MAQYTSLTRIEEEFAGRFSFGTSGTCLMSTAQGTRIINTISNYIDFKLQSRYGTASPIFGTNVWGTSDVPEIVKDCSTYLALCQMFKNTFLSITREQSDWVGTICEKGMELLELLTNGESIAYPYNGTMESEGMPIVGGNYGTIIGEEVVLNGTNLSDLQYRPVIKEGFKVYGTALDSPTQYYEGTHYIGYYYGNSNTGSNYGKIRGVASTIIPVRVDYYYIKNRIFELNDAYKWGEGHVETR